MLLSDLQARRLGWIAESALQQNCWVWGFTTCYRGCILVIGVGLPVQLIVDFLGFCSCISHAARSVFPSELPNLHQGT